MGMFSVESIGKVILKNSVKYLTDTVIIGKRPIKNSVHC